MIQIPKEDYYANMYDIENLTDLNRERTNKKSPKILSDIEKLIISNQCSKAIIEINRLIRKPIDIKELHVLKGALEEKDLEFEGLCSHDISPKNSALYELSKYLNKPEEEIEKLMLVEKPVEQSWNIINPDPTSEESVNNFYMETDSYIYELMAANNIVQTLYSFFVLIQKMKELEITTVLDYGAGVGTLSIIFKRLGYDVTYADLPGKTFDFARWRIDQRELNIGMVDLNKTLRISEKFDCVLSTEVVEHVVDPIKLIRKISEALRKDGIFVVSESCNYTEEFSSHLESNKKYGSEAFIKLMEENKFKQIQKDPFIPQLIFQKT